MHINLVYGDEFWGRLTSLSKTAKRRIFVFSAYIGRREWNTIYKLKQTNVPIVTICRDDSDFRPTVNTFLIDKHIYHGKMYLVDNVILIGSQNLYNANKNGEFSVEFITTEHDASLIAYHAFLKTCEGLLPEPEPANTSFLDFYSDRCPFCGGMPAEPDSLIRCPEYGGRFVSKEDCGSYGDSGACKYCISENQSFLGKCYVCDNSGCGFGIHSESMGLIHHQFVEQDHASIKNAKTYLSLYNYFAQRDPNFAFSFFSLMGFTGNVFNVSQQRLSWETKG